MPAGLPMTPAPLVERIATIPPVHDVARADQVLADLDEAAVGPDAPAGLAGLLALPGARALLRAVFGASPYLTGLITRDPARLGRCLTTDPDEHLTRLQGGLAARLAAATDMAGAMAGLRAFKAEVALLIALADIAGVWPVMQVTAALTRAADAAVRCSVGFLFARAARNGDVMALAAATPEEPSGYIVIAMGKHGADELNYSSDIDLIIFYDRDRLNLREGVEPEAFFVRMTRDLVRLLQERTADGYVFRVDLRLRPDPGATQVALSTVAAMHYYESFGQNWERAALIKARAVAGDIAAGTAFLAELAPYVWRKYLDYAAIADIHAMKRQIHAFKGFGEIGVAGHNIKLGRGGIREIEFFAQTQQLIAGGRQRELRTSRTLEALTRLAERKWITPAAAAELADAYRFLRLVEHRLQMIADEQTQTLPIDPSKLQRLSRFCGFDSTEAFGTQLRRRLEAVQRHYGALFETSEELTSAGGNLVFTGDDDDPATVETLASMGYADPHAAIATVKAWHFGRYPAMRSARARERLTEFLPVLLKTLAETSAPNPALAAFDRFLGELPAGVQLFSLLRSNPSLLRLLADIMGSAPRLAQSLGRRSRLLEAVLDPGFFGGEPSAPELRARIGAEIAAARDFQDALDRARVAGNEQAFLIGVRVLSGTISADRAGDAYALLAECLLGALHDLVDAELARQHGCVPGGAAAVVAMGKLGGHEMAANSDLDLIVIYDYPDGTTQSDGARPLPAPQYYSRLTQRLISAIASPTAEGRLYAVDMRLRPSGTSGPVATHLRGFTDYQREAAWTWEHMALTRARVLSGPAALVARIEAVIREVLAQPRDPGKLAADVREMRERIAAEKGDAGVWDLKQARGGLVDLEFIAQFLQLKHGHDHPGVLRQNTLHCLQELARVGLLEPAAADVLIPAGRLYQSLSQVLRLCLDGPFDPKKAPDGLKILLARAGEAPDVDRLEAQLRETQEAVLFLFGEVVC